MTLSLFARITQRTRIQSIRQVMDRFSLNREIDEELLLKIAKNDQHANENTLAFFLNITAPVALEKPLQVYMVPVALRIGKTEPVENFRFLNIVQASWRGNQALYALFETSHDNKHQCWAYSHAALIKASKEQQGLQDFFQSQADTLLREINIFNFGMSKNRYADITSCSFVIEKDEAAERLRTYANNRGIQP